jgi:hypothetical protein
MKRLFLIVAAVALLFAANGCNHPQLARHGCGDSHCNHCGSHGGPGIMKSRLAGGLAGKPGGAGSRLADGGPERVAPLPHGYQQQMGPAGPVGPQVGYPYYTIRGPRDFLVNEPNPIGR